MRPQGPAGGLCSRSQSRPQPGHCRQPEWQPVPRDLEGFLRPASCEGEPGASLARHDSISVRGQYSRYKIRAGRGKGFRSGPPRVSQLVMVLGGTPVSAAAPAVSTQHPPSGNSGSPYSRPAGTAASAFAALVRADSWAESSTGSMPSLMTGACMIAIVVLKLHTCRPAWPHGACPISASSANDAGDADGRAARKPAARTGGQEPDRTALGAVRSPCTAPGSRGPRAQGARPARPRFRSFLNLPASRGLAPEALLT